MGNLLAAQSTSLTLSQAEHIAIAIAPELQRLQATRESLRQQSIADRQLPDPKLIAGAINVPANSFSFTQDDMTMIAIGLQQSFPPGHTLAIKSMQTKARAIAEHRKMNEQTAALLRNVRETWLTLYYYIQAAHIIHENQLLYRHLLKVTESQYSVGKGSQSDVLQVQVELSRLDDQVIQIKQQIEEFRAQLGRYIGQREASRSLSTHFPSWPNPSSLRALQTRLQQHPLLKVDAANIKAACDEVALAKEQYKPGFMLDVGYAIRQGRFMNGEPRNDFVAAQITMDLPLFTRNRQDRRLQASSYQLQATRLEQQVHYRDLLKELKYQYALWQRFSERVSLYKRQLRPEAKQNSKAALLAYQSATADLTTTLRAYSNELTIQLEQLQIEVARAKARAALFYLEGVTA
ncbi:TPA: TolC family protein [Legionella pneumophila]|nr:TolC family protein [Legionella pneumophila]HAT1860713.1 TolC family protein [Legionella pneumophila]HAU2155528.1 TolC family protein [Legionella pneumophila]